MATYIANWNNGPMGPGFLMMLPRLRRAQRLSAGPVGTIASTKPKTKKQPPKHDRRRDDATSIAILLLMENQS